MSAGRVLAGRRRGRPAGSGGGAGPPGLIGGSRLSAVKDRYRDRDGEDSSSESDSSDERVVSFRTPARACGRHSSPHRILTPSPIAPYNPPPARLHEGQTAPSHPPGGANPPPAPPLPFPPAPSCYGPTCPSRCARCDHSALEVEISAHGHRLPPHQPPLTSLCSRPLLLGPCPLLPAPGRSIPPGRTIHSPRTHGPCAGSPPLSQTLS